MSAARCRGPFARRPVRNPSLPLMFRIRHLAAVDALEQLDEASASFDGVVVDRLAHFRRVAQAQAFGIQGVPFFVIDGKYGIAGAQDPATFAQALEQVRSERA